MSKIQKEKRNNNRRWAFNSDPWKQEHLFREKLVLSEKH